jgi:undecaprenyl-diphosphatase
MATTHEVPTVDDQANAWQTQGEATPDTTGDHELADRPHERRLRDINRTWPLTWGDGARFLAVYVVMSGVFIAIGMLITHPLQHSWLQRTDQHIEVWLSQHRTHTLNDLTFIGSQLADTVVKIAATALIALGMLLAWRRWKEPLFVVAALILEASVFITTTWTVGRPRPNVPRLETSPVGSSFPSGHVAAAVVYSAIAVVVFWHTRKRWARVLAVCVVTFIVLAAGFSRMYRGMHHLSDVIAGIVLGLVAVTATYLIVQRAVERRELDHPRT